MTPEQAIQFLNTLIETKTIATKLEFVQAQQAIDVLANAIKPVVETKPKK